MKKKNSIWLFLMLRVLLLEHWDEIRIFYLETKEYDKFTFLKDNREVTDYHAKKIADSFQIHGQLVPIVCKKQNNGKLYIIDGQYRYTAAKNLGIPIKYTVNNFLKVINNGKI